MSGVYNTRSMAKGNEAVRGDASATPDNPGYSRIREERGHEARVPSNNTTTHRCSHRHRLIILLNEGRTRPVLHHQNNQGTVVRRQTKPGQCRRLHHRRLTTMGPEMVPILQLSNVPTTSNNARMVQTIAPSSLLSDNNAVPTGSGTATFQNIKTMRMFASSSSIGYDEPGGLEDGPMLSFYPSSPTGTQP